MITIIAVLCCIVFTIFCISAGYKLAMLRWSPQDLINRLEKYSILNKELTDGIRKLYETNKMNTAWYMNQLNNVAVYLKEKYQDSYVSDQLKNIPGYISPEDDEPEYYDIDTILDKASKHGFESLNEGEKNYLKKPKE